MDDDVVARRTNGRGESSITQEGGYGSCVTDNTFGNRVELEQTHSRFGRVLHGDESIADDCAGAFHLVELVRCFGGDFLLPTAE